MSLPYPTKTRTWDLGTSANGTFFDTEFNQLYANDVYLEARVMPAGAVIQHAGTTAPTGYLACNAAEVSRSTYAALFSAIGTLYGAGDGSTTFNLPDMRGLFVRGAGAHGTMTKAAGGAFDGGSVGATNNDKFQAHYMNRNSSAVTEQVLSGSGGSDYTGGGKAVNGLTTTGGPVTDGSNGTPRTGNETKPASISLLYCIKT